QIGSCTANAIAAALEFDQLKQKSKGAFTPSRLFIYYNERVTEGSVDQDAGAMIRDGIKSVAKQGACKEETWPYDPNPFPPSDLIPPMEPNAKMAVKPSAAAYTEAKKYKAVQYKRVTRTLSQMKGCLASGFPFVFGFSVYDSFETKKVAKSGIVPMPSPSENMIGGHAVLAVGYDETKDRFIVRNSWGDKWGMKGYFTIPFAYLLDENLSDDFWTVRTVSGTE